MKEFWKILFFSGLCLFFGMLFGASVISEGQKSDIENGFVESNDNVYEIIKVYPKEEI